MLLIMRCARVIRDRVNKDLPGMCLAFVTCCLCTFMSLEENLKVLSVLCVKHIEWILL